MALSLPCLWPMFEYWHHTGVLWDKTPVLWVSSPGLWMKKSGQWVVKSHTFWLFRNPSFITPPEIAQLLLKVMPGVRHRPSINTFPPFLCDYWGHLCLQDSTAPDRFFSFHYRVKERENDDRYHSTVPPLSRVWCSHVLWWVKPGPMCFTEWTVKLFRP